MTPKQQADELITKYKNNVYRKAFSDSDEYKDRWYIIDNETAKQCALIAVDKIIEATSMYQYGINNALEHIPTKIVKHPYWIDVKTEIETL